jgi:hypothetical protein
MLVGTMFLRPRALRALRYDCGDQVALVVSASGGAEDVAMAVTVNAGLRGREGATKSIILTDHRSLEGEGEDT